MSAFCLIPVTRPRRAVYAARSADRLGWQVLTQEDTGHRGPNWVRNELLQVAAARGATVVRFLDDDDLALCITAQEALAMSVDAMYVDYLVTHPVIVRHRVRQVGDLRQDGYYWLVGNWCARVDALLSLDPGGRPWVDHLPYCEGAQMALKMARAGLKIGFTPKAGYYWHKRLDGLHTAPQNRLVADVLTDLWTRFPAVEVLHV